MKAMVNFVVQTNTKHILSGSNYQQREIYVSEGIILMYLHLSEPFIISPCNN